MAQATRRWRHFYPATLLIGLLLQLHLGYLLVVDHLNTVPDTTQLVRVPVEVLQVQDRVPHLRVRLADDSQRGMELPVSAAWFAPLRSALSAEEWKDLPGCMGYVLGAPMRWVRGERFRIWELHCGPVHRVYGEFRAAYEAAAPGGQRLLEWHGGIILLLTLAVLGLERRAWRRQRRGEAVQ